MSQPSGNVCAVCGQILCFQDSAYLLLTRSEPLEVGTLEAGNVQSMEHRLAILRWHRALAEQDETQGACSPAHALEMVAHWMVSGRLDFICDLQATPAEPAWSHVSSAGTPLTGSYRPIGEVVIHRESVRELIAHDPEALASVLDSLLEALLRDRNPDVERKPVVRTTRMRHANTA